MKITEEEVKKIGTLSKLDLTGDELETITKDFQELLNMMEVLNEVDVEHVQIEPHTLETTNIFRNDEVFPSLPIKEIKKNSPKFEATVHVVPKVVDNA